MSYWEQNIEGIKVCQKSLARLLAPYKDMDTSDVVSEILAKDQTPALVLHVNGKDHVMNSRFRPMVEAESYASQFDEIKDKSVVMFFGFGNGTFPKAIYKRGSDDLVFYIFYEPCLASFIYTMHHHDLTELFGTLKTHIYVEGVNADGMGALLPDIIDWANMPLAKMMHLPKYRELYPESYKHFAHIIEDNFSRLHMAKNTTSAFAKKFMENVILHMRYAFEATSGRAFIGAFPKNLPAILVSAGPSLAKQMDILKQAKGHAFILCVDTALRKLLAEGIEPDAVIGVDANKWAAYHEDYIPHYERMMWIAETICNHAIMRYVKSYRNVMLDSGDQINHDIYKKAGCELPSLPTGGSVANTAFALLELWGFETVILVGQDLALTGNRRHADSETDAEKEAQEKGYNIIPVEGYYGDTVKTRDDYLTYLKWFESEIAITDCKRVINATEGGAMIHGATNMPLQEALEQYAKESYDIRAIIDQVPRTLSEKDKDELEKRLLDFPKRASYFIRMFKEGRDLTERGITLLNRGQAEGKEFSDLQKRLGEIDASVSNELEFVLICNRASDVDRKIARELTVKEEQDESPVDIMQSMHELYEAFLEAAKDMKEYAEAMVKQFELEGRR